jgi:hypothetical protein
MDSASPDTECIASETPSSDSGVNTFFARTFKQAEFAPKNANLRNVGQRGRGYRGAYHPQATGDGPVR